MKSSRVSLSVCAALLTTALAASSPALAQEGTTTTAGSGAPAWGVGASSMLTQPIALQIAYDPGAWHAEGLLGFLSANGTRIQVAGRFWYHLHATSSSDFSLGGGLGIINNDPDGNADSTTLIHVDAAAQLRVFIVPNVALSGTAGIGFVTGEDNADAFGIFAQGVGSLGVTYFFR